MSIVNWLVDYVNPGTIYDGLDSWFRGPSSNETTTDGNDEGTPEQPNVIAPSVNGTSARFLTGDQSGDEILEWTLDIEGDWLEDLLNELEEDDVFFDVGANLGVYSCFAQNVLESGIVVAFEPYPPNIRQLKENMNLNEGNFRVVEKALADEENRTNFTSSESDDVGYATGTLSPEESNEGVEIPTIAGDELVQDGPLPEPDVVKIDVEGSEPLVLEGLSDTLNGTSCRLIYCEIHLSKEGRPCVSDYGSSADSVKKTIRDFGFSVDNIVRRNQELHLKATR